MGTLMHCWWECKMVQLLWKTLAIPQKARHRINYHVTQQFHS